MKRICRDCGIEKDICEFYNTSNSNGWNGPRPECKKCKKKNQTIYRKSDDGKEKIKKWYKINGRTYHAKWRINNREKIKQWYLENKEKIYEKTKIYRENNPEKYKAHWIAARKIKIKKPCKICGAFPTHKHHPNYKKPLEVIFLCHSHHKLVHLGEVVL